MAYATVDDALYVQGGSLNSRQNIDQFFVLDLAQHNWNQSRPPWKALDLSSDTQSALNTSNHAMTVSKDKHILIISKSSGIISTFNIASKSWQGPHALSKISVTLGSCQAVTDTNTGLVYIPNGADNGANMIIYNPSDDSSLIVPMPATSGQQGLAFFAAAWSTARQSILLYGGLDTEDVYSYLVEYQPSSSKWINLETTGPSPGNVSAPCMVSAYGGSKMIVFGGISTNLFSTLGSIYILDIQTLTWTNGIDVDPSQNRTGMACAIVGDNFVVWGGINNLNSHIEPLIAYNIKTSMWTKPFSGPDAMSDGRITKGFVSH